MIHIAIPIYKSDPDITDIISINSIISANKGIYKVSYVCGNSLNISKYPKLNAIRFDDNFFVSTTAYSTLLENPSFYEKFLEHKYVLIYQTDCYVIRPDDYEEQMKFWINEEYDYIGAPVVSDISGWENPPCVGNGGCSMRKVKKMYDICSNKDIVSKIFDTSQIRRLMYAMYEDMFFCEAAVKYTDMDIPTYKEAAKFAWDMSIEWLGACGYNIPLFVHGWAANMPYWRYFSKEINDRYDECIEYVPLDIRKMWRKTFNVDINGKEIQRV